MTEALQGTERSITRVVVIADSGSVMADLTAAVGLVSGAYIVRYGSGGAPLERMIAQIGPDLVVIGDLRMPREALARLAEVRLAAPGAKVVVLSSSPEASWLADALRADASAVLPGNVEPQTLAVVLREVITGPAPRGAEARPASARPTATGRRARPRRTGAPHDEPGARRLTQP
jgi:DNA-binding NarL/FixJ family response regulator